MSRRQLSRQVQAFESLLRGPDDEDEGGRGVVSGQKLSARSRSQRRSSKDSHKGQIKGFKLKEESQVSPDDSGSGRVLDNLIQLFQDALPADAVNDVYVACNRSFETTMATLLGLTSQEEVKAKEPSEEERESPLLLGSQQPINLPINLWDCLPSECKTLILNHLSLRDLSRLAVTSREFAGYVEAQRKNLRTLIVPTKLSMQALQGLVTAFSASSGINLCRWGSYLRFPNDFADVAEAIAKGIAGRGDGCAKIEFLSLSRCTLATDDDIATMCSFLPSLRSLDLSRCTTLTDTVLSLIALYRRQPFSPTVDTPDQHDSPDAAASIERLERPRDAAIRIANANANANAHTIGDREQHNHGGGLEDINLSGTMLTSSGISSLLRGGSRRARDLITLDVSRCPKVTSDAIIPGPLSPLQTLKASGCAAIRSIHLALDFNSKLRSVNVADCKLLTEFVVSSAPALEDLNISGCVALHTLNLCCPRLTRIRASGCSALGSQGPIAMSGCQKLREASFFGCRSLDSASIEGMLPRFIHLETLDLSGCISIGRIVATAEGSLPALKSLRVDGCVVLRTLTIVAPKLEDLFARGCCRLMVSVMASVKFTSCSFLKQNCLCYVKDCVYLCPCRRFPSLVLLSPP